MPSPNPFNFIFPFTNDWDKWHPQWEKQFQLFLLTLQGKLPALQESLSALQESLLTLQGSFSTLQGNLPTFASGATLVADGGTIAHGMSVAPSLVLITPTIADQVVAVTAIDASTFTVAIKNPTGGVDIFGKIISSPGTTQIIYWIAKQ